jgi:hypothetical protein
LEQLDLCHEAMVDWAYHEKMGILFARGLVFAVLLGFVPAASGVMSSGWH